MKRRTIVVVGGLAQRAGYGGHAWVFLQYLLGFRRLGYDVLFVDRLETEWCADDDARRRSAEQTRNIAYLERAMSAIGTPIPYAVLCDGGTRVIGMERDELIDRMRRSVMLLDVMGFLDDDELLDAAPLRVFLDVDPGFPQMWRALGWADLFTRHDAYVTIGANIGRSDCRIPTGGVDWLTTRPPVVLEHWPAARDDASTAAITTVAAWRGPFSSIEYEGETYGLRAHQFRRFSALPRRTDASFELALDIDPADERDRDLLLGDGWALAEPRDVAADVGSYRSYVQRSRAELMIAKGMYVQARSGWFSDRSACYLASGRPVLAQDTGLRDRYPLGAGLLTFSTLEEAVVAVERLDRGYAHHAVAARRIAEEYFDSDRVLGLLLRELGVAASA
ncbi:MAG: hypothetical protein QOH28_646 [Actinomycetota bacterium]|jgi:hypothetical protein|nr:hypothetical protein [Actinomycetota bacterium]